MSNPSTTTANGNTHRRHRILAFALAIGAVTGTASCAGPTADEATGAASTAMVDAEVATVPAAADHETAAPVDLQVPASGNPHPGPPVPAAPQAPDVADAGPAVLDVTDTFDLAPGSSAGSFTVANVGGDSLEWTAWPDAAASVDLGHGTLVGGESVVIYFVIDRSQLPAGPFAVRIMIDSPGVGAQDLWVHGNNVEISSATDLSAG